MDEFSPIPSQESIDDARQRWQEGTDTFGRVYDVALGITTPTTSAEIADIADCSANAAKKHLERLTEMGIVRATREGRPVQYTRNDSYLEWQEASRIADELSVEEIIERVQALEDERETYEERFETTDPTTVSVFNQGDHDAIHDRMTAISNWHGISRDIRLYELARQIVQNDGHLIPA
ncbi:helix-turn-helix domain-containing protein [Halocatena marina]|uniref:Helix-turn-helix domain-containing protein n=1 Tax=Halocatena marina TaxID=2934937 RepID=A0ABD5YTN9_9EURY|nr:helix-turn-helix domain-containing protein [Halocatena marina]